MSQSQYTTRRSTKKVYEGIAAEDLAPDSTVLKVICPELTPGAVQGAIGAGITNGVTKITDRDGTPISVGYTSSNHIVATWEGGSNMRSPPQIRKGETVTVYQLADQDRYLWKAGGLGRDFRKTDRVTFEVAAMPDSSVGGEKNDTNTYSATLDSINQKMFIKSSKANGEAVAFNCEFDLKAGTMTISDDSESPGNRIHLDSGVVSGSPLFQVNLSTGLTLKFENENAMITVPKKLLINAGERIVLNSPMTVFNLSQAGAVIINAANIALNGAKDVIITGSVFGVSAASSKFAGILIAQGARIANIVKGALGGSYSPTTVNRPQESPLVSSSNTPDTSMTGTPYD